MPDRLQRSTSRRRPRSSRTRQRHRARPGHDRQRGQDQRPGRRPASSSSRPTRATRNGDNDPDPRAHRTGQTNPISGPNTTRTRRPARRRRPPPTAEAQDMPCAANKLVITPAAPVPAGQSVKVQIDYSGRPGVHSDGDGTTEGWFRSVNPADDGGFVTTEPMGTEDWMPLNDHPTGKPTYDFTTVTNIDRTAISNGELVSHDTNPSRPAVPGRAGDGRTGAAGRLGHLEVAHAQPGAGLPGREQRRQLQQRLRRRRPRRREDRRQRDAVLRVPVAHGVPPTGSPPTRPHGSAGGHHELPEDLQRPVPVHVRRRDRRHPARLLRGGDGDQDHVRRRLDRASARSTTRTCTSGGATTWRRA